MEGYVKIFRQMMEWEWYQDNNVKSIFLHCLLLANHKKRTWKGQEIDCGSFVTSINKLSIQTGLSIQEVRTSLKKLEKTNEIFIKSTKKNTQISIVKWGVFQINDNFINKQVTIIKQSNNKQSTTNKNDNNEKNVKNEKNTLLKNPAFEFIPPTLHEVSNYINENSLDVDAEFFIDYHETVGWRLGNSLIRDWKALLRKWDYHAEINGW